MAELTTRKGWTRVAFGDVVQLVRERTSDPGKAGLDRFVGLEHMESGDPKIRRWGHIAAGTTFTNVFRAGQALFGKRRAYQRKVAVADFDGVCSGDIYVLEPRNERLLPDLLPYICRTDEFFDHAVGTSAGSLSPRTNWDSLATFEFALPPAEEQQRLSRVLRAIQAATDSLDFAMERTEAVRLSLIGRHFASAAKPGLHYRPLSELATRVNDGTHQPPAFTKSGVPFLLVSNIATGVIDWKAEKHVSVDVFEQLSRVWRPQLGDVLYSLVGSYGVPAMVDRDVPFTFQRHIGIIRTDAEQLLPKYLYWYLRSPMGLQQAHLMAEGLAQKTITLGALRGFKVPAPTLMLQRSAICELDATHAAIHALEDRMDSLRCMAKTIAAAAFSGAQQ